LKKIIFLGNREETLNLLYLFFDVSLVVTNNQSRVHKNLKKKILIINSKNKKKIFKILTKSKAEIIVSAGFPFLIPEYVLKKFKININCHPGKLPEYKGFKSIDYAYSNKDVKFYSTIHHMNEKIDCGKKILDLNFNAKNLDLHQIKQIYFSFFEPYTLFLALKKIKLI